MKNVAVIIPARYSSKRFPSKALTLIHGKPLILHVIERIQGAYVSDIIVATDHEEIRNVVITHGVCKVEMTDSHHSCGTDRIAEVAANLSADYILNVQGDELVSGPDILDKMISHIHDDLHIATLYTDLNPYEELSDLNIVKVLTNMNGNMIYMSRTPIPFDRGSFDGKIKYYKQVGLYLFRREVLLKFSNLEPSRLESIEGIELLRALDYGIPLKGIYIDQPTCDVNIPEDVLSAEAFIKKYKINR